HRLDGDFLGNAIPKIPSFDMSHGVNRESTGSFYLFWIESWQYIYWRIYDMQNVKPTMPPAGDLKRQPSSRHLQWEAFSFLKFCATKGFCRDRHHNIRKMQRHF